jgi:hypothetical protein
MNEMDEWGRDPSVQGMRDVFSRMEVAQEQLLDQLNISPFDSRLRGVREAAKDLFERSWALANARHVNMDAEKVARLYLYCLAFALDTCGIQVPGELLLEEEPLGRLVSEVLS